MKKLLFAIALFCALLALVCNPVSAADTPEESIGELYEILPPDAYAVLDGKLTGDGTAGELVGVESLLSYLVTAAKEGFAATGGQLLRIVGVTLLSVLCSLFCRGMSGERMAELCERAVGLFSALAFFGIFYGSLSGAIGWCADLSSFSRGIAPILGGLLLFGGNTGTAAAGATAFSAFLFVAEELASGFLMQLIAVLFALTLVGCFGKRNLTEGLFSFVRSVYLTLLSLLCTLLGASLGLQGMLASSADTLAAKTAKFALGNLVPVVGGTVSATLGTAAASVSVIKSTVGIGAVVTVLLLTLPQLISLWYLRMCFSLCGSLSGMLGCAEITRQMKEFRALFDLLMATVAILSILFLFLVTLLSKSAVAFA